MRDAAQKARVQREASTPRRADLDVAPLHSRNQAGSPKTSSSTEEGPITASLDLFKTFVREVGDYYSGRGGVSGRLAGLFGVAVAQTNRILCISGDGSSDV
jgi:hypothetical protein